VHNFLRDLTYFELSFNCDNNNNSSSSCCYYSIAVNTDIIVFRSTVVFE